MRTKTASLHDREKMFAYDEDTRSAEQQVSLSRSVDITFFLMIR